MRSGRRVEAALTDLHQFGAIDVGRRKGIIRMMAKKSDLRSGTGSGREHRVSATVASRSFSRLLDEVESGGGPFLVHRRGHEVCVMGPPPVAPRRASECIAYLRDRSPVVLDGRFGDDLRSILAGEPVEDSPSWGS